MEFDIDGNPVTPTSDRIELLCATLKELSMQADKCSRIEYLDSTLREQTISSWTTPSSFGMDASHNGTSASSSSSSSVPFSSPLGFLQMVLPDVPSAELRKALDNYDGEDLWDIIAVIVAEEAIRETEERGLEGSGEDGIGWEVVQRKRKEKSSKKKAPIKPKKLVLADMRQQHHEQYQEQRPSRRRNRSISGVSSSTVDPWTWISSLSSRLASLLPTCSPTTFSSFLHSPHYLTSYDAVRACLTSLCKSHDLSDRQTELLINLLDIIMPDDDDLDIHMRSQIISDVELAVCVTEGQEDNALDLAYLLCDLDGPDMGLNNFRPQLSPSTTHFSQGSPPSLSTTVTSLRHPPGSPDIPPPRGKVRVTPKRPSLKTNAHQWKTVPSRTTKATHNTYSRADSNNLSAFEQDNIKTNSTLRMRHAMAKSRQALMDASIMYQKRSNKNGGGEVAFYYAERVCDTSPDIFCYLTILSCNIGKRMETNREARSTRRCSRNGPC